jgi:hypothetical protein
MSDQNQTEMDLWVDIYSTSLINHNNDMKRAKTEADEALKSFRSKFKEPQAVQNVLISDESVDKILSTLKTIKEKIFN